MPGLMQPGPTLYEAEERRKRAGSQGLLAAVGEPLSYAPGPLGMMGNTLLGAQYLTGEKPLDEGMSSLAMMSALLQGTKAAPIINNAIKVYHGSPHKFDKPDSSKIGTGEGAQAYGHGLYWAETPGVAKSYAQPMPPVGMRGDDVGKMKTADEYATAALWAFGNKKASSALLDAARFGDDMRFPDKNLAKQAAQLIKDGKAVEQKANLYEANLRWPDPAREAKDPLGPQHFLNWDKPLSEQPELKKVAGRLSDHIYDVQAAKGTPDHLIQNVELRGTGEDFVRSLEQALGAMRGTSGRYDKEASDSLKNLGIPGITYLDAGSRHLAGWEVGMADPLGKKWVLKNHEMAPSLWKTFDSKAAAEAALKAMPDVGTRNYVTFDDALVELLKRNGTGLLGK